MFMLLEVPEPVWKTSIGNWLSSLPSMTSVAAANIESTCASSNGFLPVPVSFPKSRFATPQAYLTRPMAWIIAGGISQPEIGKFWTARWVCAP